MNFNVVAFDVGSNTLLAREFAQGGLIAAFFEAIHRSESEESQCYLACKALWGATSYAFSRDYPPVLFGTRAVDHKLFQHIASKRLALECEDEIRERDVGAVDADFPPLRTHYSGLLKSMNENVENAMTVVNARCALEQLSPVMDAAPVTSTPPTATTGLFPITVHFVPGVDDVDITAIRNRLRHFEEEYVLYTRLNTAYLWTFDEARVDYCRVQTEHFPGMLLDEDILELFRKVLLGKIAKWITDNPTYWKL